MALEAARLPRRSPGRLPAFDVPAAWLGAIVAAAAVLRLVPIWFGLPYLHARPDEETAIGHAVEMLGGDLNPHFFHWPSLTFYLFAAVFAAWTAAVSAVSGRSVADVEYLLLARGIVAIAGTLTTVVLFHLVHRLTDVATGLLAAAFLAVAILHVRESHFAMTDVLMTLLLTASLALLLGALDEAVDEAVTAPDRRRIRLAPFAVAGFAGGLAASTKYSAGAVVVAMAAAQIVLARRFSQRFREPRTWPPSLAFLAACAAGFFLATPYALLDAGTFAADLRFDFTHLSGGHGIDLGRGWWYHATHSLPYGVGFFTLLAAGAGIVPFARDRPREAFVLGTFAAAFYLAIGSGYTVFFRYVLPIVPVVCLLAAVGVRYGGPWVAAKAGVSSATGTVLLAGAVLTPPLVNSIWFDAVLARTDTRVLAARWLAPRIRPGESLHDAGGDYATLDLGPTAYHVWHFDPATGSFGDPEGRTPDWLVLHQSPLRLYARIPPGLRRLANDRYDLVQEFRATRSAAASAMYDQQDAFFMPVSGFRAVARPGPTVLIYQRRTPSQSPGSPALQFSRSP